MIIAHDKSPLPETPWEALGPIVREKVFIGDRMFLIEYPSESDRILDHPAAQSALAADYLPFWADLWPAARMLAKAILQENWTPGTEALEIGCGLGLPGIAALDMGLRVTFSDYDATALRFAGSNARLNGFKEFSTLQLDWHSPPENLRVPIVFGSDLIYQVRNVEPLVGLIKQILHRDGVCLLTDQDRVPTHVLREALSANGMTFTAQTVRAGEPGGQRVKGTLYRVRRRT